jgi:hypothetical protein
MNPSAVDKVKVWLFPTLVSVIGILLYQEIKEIKSDVKALLAQSNIDKTRIDNIERYLFTEPIKQVGQRPLDKEPPLPIKLIMQEFVLPSKNEFDDEEA